MTQRVDRVLLSVVVAISTYWLGRFYDRGINVLDEGFIAAASIRLLQGDIPYLDFFTLLTPGVFLLHAALYGIFGPSLWIGRCVILIVGIGIPVLVYLIGRNRLRPTTCLVAAVLSLVWGPTAWEYVTHANYNWLAHFFGLLALWGCSKSLPDQSNGAVKGTAQAPQSVPWLWVGIALGLSILFKQTIGAYAFFAITIFSCAYERGAARYKALLHLSLGALLIHLPVLIWLGVQGALPAMIRHILIIPLSEFARAASVPYPALWPLWPQFPAVDLEVGRQFLALLPLSYLVMTAWIFLDGWRSKKNRPNVSGRTVTSAFEPLIVLYSAFMFLGNFPRADYTHLIYSLATGYLVFVMLLERLHQTVKHHLGAKNAGLMMLCLALLFARPAFEYPVRLTLWTLGVRSTPINTDRAGVTTSPREANALNGILATIAQIKAAGQEVFVLPNAPMLFFLGDVPNPTRYDLLIPGNYEPSTMQEVMTILEKRRVPWVVLHHLPVDGEVVENYAPELMEYLRSNYQTKEKNSDYELLWRPSDATAMPLMQPAALAISPSTAPSFSWFRTSVLPGRSF
jgi:Dolichyl-phosphate-mannose-protein mannosyltransferase